MHLNYCLLQLVYFSILIIRPIFVSVISRWSGGRIPCDAIFQLSEAFVAVIPSKRLMWIILAHKINLLLSLNETHWDRSGRISVAVHVFLVCLCV